MTAILLLIRHAAHAELGSILSGRRPDVVLSAEGVRQAQTVAQRLASEPIAAVYASPCERARHTAHEIASPHALNVAIDERLDEIDFGDWQGRSFAELEHDAGWRQWNAARGAARPPGGEGMAAATARAVSALDDFVERHDGRTVAAISHCDIIRGVLAHYLRLSLDNLLRFDVDPASVSRVALGGGRRVISINERVLP